MANNLNSNDQVVVTINTREGVKEVSARVLRVFGPEAPGLVQVRVNGLDTNAPMWGEAFITKAEMCEKSHV